MKLNDISILKNGKKCKYDEDGQIPIYGSNGVIGYTDKSNSRKNSIVIGRVGANAGSVFFSSQDHWVSDNAISVTPDTDKVNPHYLYYVLVKLNLNRLVEGSAQPLLNQSILNSFEIKIPDIQTQNKVVERINVFDKKIVLNKKINDNLLELLDTEFSHRFINNSDYSTGKISDFVSIKRGASPRPIKDYLSDKGRAWIKISDVTKLTSPFLYGTGQFIKETGIDKSRTIKPGTLILSNSATPGIPIISEILASVHDGWLIINNYKYMDRNWFYLFFRQMRRQLVSRANGSVFNNLKTSIVKNFPVPIATEEELSDFKKFADPIFDKLNQLQQESIALGKLKDSLLKKYF